ncbi:MAG: tetratricopeptide repeat protein [Bernardetiaceae bacterium]
MKQHFFWCWIGLWFFGMAAVRCSGQEIDSLQALLPSLEGASRVSALNRLCWGLRNSDARQAFRYGQEAINYAEQINDQSGLCVAYSYTGVTLRNLGNYSEAFTYYERGLQIAEQINDQEQLGYACINLGNLYIYQDQPEPALRYLKRAIPIAKGLKNPRMEAYVYLNLGRVYIGLQRFEEAEQQLWLSYSLRGQLGAIKDQLVALKYIADTKFYRQQPDSALFYYEQIISNPDALSDSNLIGSAANQAAQCYLQKENLPQAKALAEQSLSIGQGVGSKLRMKDAYITLAQIADREQDYPKLAALQKKIIQYKDSLFSDELAKKIAALEFSSQQKQQAAQIQIQDLEIKRQRVWRNAMTAILALAAALIFFLIYSNKKRLAANQLLQQKTQQIKAQNEELQQYTHQVAQQRDGLQQLNERLSEKQVQIEASITYAQRIQQAVRPNQFIFSTHFPDYFIWELPRDIVTGDFYWVSQHQNCVLVGVGDCTGHGVPGAFMSLLATSFLHQIAGQIIDQLHEPDFEIGLILDQLREKIKQSLHQSNYASLPDDQAVKDGLDISLCMIDKQNQTMQFTGAFGMGIFIQEQKHLISLRGNRMPVGVYPLEKPFETQHFSFRAGDKLYLFSDGYPDQMGGEEGRKFLGARFKKMIFQYSHLSMPQQKEAIIRTFEQWRGELGQTDDVIVLGIEL